MNDICLFCFNMTAIQWLGLGIALLSFELMFPGVFMLWFGLGALITAGLVYLFGVTNIVAIGVFLVAGLALSYCFYKKQNKDSKPLVNNPKGKMVGTTVILEEAITNGRGRTKVGDSHWSVSGPDLAAGTKVKVTDVNGNTLVVVSAE
jgi:membrane protein implicated in regulation of membrane protease activity